jgi:hypothetical protein
MPFDLDILLGSDPSGLLTPQERGGVTGQGLMGMGAALLKAAAPSPYKHTTLSGLGEGIQGLVSGQNTARDQMLKQQLVRANVFDKFLPVFKAAQQYDALSQPRPPELQRMLNVFGNMTTGGPFGRGPSGVAQPGTVAQGGVSPPPGAAAAPGATVAPGAPAAPTGNLVVDTARGMGVNPGMLMEGMPGQAAAAKAIEERIHATDPALSEAEFKKEVMKERVARDAKMYPAIIEMGHQAQSMKENADLSVALMKNKNFFSGLGAQFVEPWKQLAAKFGEDPNAANPIQVYNKITAANINEQIGAMRTAAAAMGPGIGRVFQLQAELMAKASQSMRNEPGANLVLANMQQRAAANMQAITDMAFRHKKEHQILGPEFDEEASKYLAAHPVLSPAELKNLSMTGTVEGALGAPPTPAAPAGAGAAPVPGAIGPLGGQGGSAPKPGAYNWTPNGMVPVQ